MCGRMQLVFADDVREVRLLRSIPFIVISVPADIDADNLKKSLSQWLDASQRRCAMSLWESRTDTDAAGAIVMCETRG